MYREKRIPLHAHFLMVSLDFFFLLRILILRTIIADPTNASPPPESTEQLHIKVSTEGICGNKRLVHTPGINGWCHCPLTCLKAKSKIRSQSTINVLPVSLPVGCTATPFCDWASSAFFWVILSWCITTTAPSGNLLCPWPKIYGSGSTLASLFHWWHSWWKRRVGGGTGSAWLRPTMPRALPELPMVGCFVFLRAQCGQCALEGDGDGRLSHR